MSLNYLAFFSLLAMINATSNEATYRVRSVERRAQALIDPSEFVLTHSDDGKSKELPPFLVDIFEVRGDLNEEAFPALRGAMNKFLLAELNAIYEPDRNELTAVGTEIWEHTKIKGSGRLLQGANDGNKQGVELDMSVTLTFDNEPSPPSAELDIVVQTIMSDLKYFVANLTAFEEEQLPDVTEAHRREYPTESPTKAPVDNTDKVTNGVDNGGANKAGRRVASSVVTTSLLGATFIALAVYLIFRRKRQTIPESPKGDMMYVDVENDLYSMDRSLESSQSPDVHSPPGDSVQYSMSPDGTHVFSPIAGDSVFSGVDSPTSTHNAGTTKSLMSGFTHASASTIRASNIEKTARLHSAPRSLSMAAHGSLFAFSEGGFGAYDDDDDLSDRDSPKMTGPPSLTKSEVSDDTQGDHPNAAEAVASSPSETSSCLQGAAIEEPPSVLGQQRVWCGAAPAGSSSHVLADLAVLASSRGSGSPRDPTPTVAQSTVSAGDTRDPTPRSGELSKQSDTVSYNPFNCNPIYTTDPEHVAQNYNEEGKHEQPEASQSTNSAKVTRKPERDSPLTVNNASDMETPMQQNSLACPPSVNSTMETPLKRNFALASAAPGSATAQRSAKSTGSGQIQLEWDHEVSPTVASMSAQATQIIGGVYGAEGSPAVNRSRNSTMDGGSKPVTPRSERGSKTSTPTKGGASSQPVTPQGRRMGGRWFTSRLAGRAPATPPGDDDYVDNLSRPSTPGGEFNTSLQVSDYASEYNCLPFSKMVDKAPPAQNGSGDPSSAENAAEGAFFPASNGRRHAGNKLGGDGSAMYQTNAMHPLDWSYKSADVASVGDSTISENEGTAIPRQFLFTSGKREGRASASPRGDPRTPMSEGSGRTGGTTKDTTGSSHASASRQLINDLVWLEKKIADVRQGSRALVDNEDPDLPPAIDTVDSLSYVSNDNDVFLSATSNDDSQDDEDPTVSTGRHDSVMSSIVCRDCYAPPGKLHIVIHSTKDGPAVHTVKEGSSLEGHIFPGDLIISVDNVDTRSYTAEQVMKMMASKSDRERKITVLHFEEED